MVKAAVLSAMETISAVLAAREGQNLFANRWWDSDWWVETSQLVFLVGLFLDAISRYIMGNLSIWDASVIANLKDNSMGWTSEGSYKQLTTSLCHVISALDVVNVVLCYKCGSAVWIWAWAFLAWACCKIIAVVVCVLAVVVHLVAIVVHLMILWQGLKVWFSQE
jgi:hypothetical protein